MINFFSKVQRPYQRYGLFIFFIKNKKRVKTGPGGLQSKDEFSPAHRNIHSSHIGNMSATATPESANVGIITQHTMNPLILNKYGS